MSAIALILAILLTNQVTTQTNITTSLAGLTSEIKTFPDGSTENAFALQIPRIRATSEETPAASAGNNLDFVGPSLPSNSVDVQEENFQAIFTVYSIEKTKSDEKKYNDGNEGNAVQSGSGNDLANEQRKSTKGKKGNLQITEPMKLVWDNCLETVYRDNYKSESKSSNDMEHVHSLKTSDSKSVATTISKRDSMKNNNSTALKAWLEKYNNLKKAKEDELSREKLNNLLFKNTSVTSLSVPVTTVPVVPITRDILKDYIKPVNVSLDVVVTENNIKANHDEDWLNGKDRTKIKFSSLPQTQTYLIPKFKLEEGFHPFGFMSEFFDFIYPFDFPVGLIKDIVWGRFTFPYSFLQSIKVESTFLVFIIIFACIALIIPCYLLILAILSLISRTRCRDDVLESGALFPQAEETTCSDRILTIVTFIVVVLCCLLIAGMIVSNEQSRTAATDSRNVVSCACTDIGAWLSAAGLELHHSFVPPMDLVVYAYRNDLDNIESLLGEPIQQAIASESGIELVFDSLTDIIAETEDISKKITSLRNVSTKAGLSVAVASDKVKELARLIDSHKKQCASSNAKDAPLCDTLNTNSLDLHMKLDTIFQQESQLLELKVLGVNNLTSAISAAKKQFKVLPSVVTTQTAPVREDIMRDIEQRRQSIHSSSRIFNEIVRHLQTSLHDLASRLEIGMDRLQKYEFWRWLFILACNVAFSFVMLLILAGMLCGCGRAQIHAKRTLQVSSVWLCVISLILWGVICAVFLIAGHAEVYVCHALWDTPTYNTLSALLDKPSPFLKNDEGIFDAIFRDLENVTIDISVKDILRDCELNRPAYNVFQLNKLLDMNKETSYFEWEELQADLGRLSSSIDVGLLKTISLSFSKLLNDILVVTNVDLAKYRMEYNEPLVGKDLPSLADQLENIAAQVTDLNTAGRLETLATRTKRLHLTTIKPLEQLRADLVFKLTELELQLTPFRKKLNISLSHIHTAQYYIDNQGDIIAQKKVSTYVSRLVSHMAGWRTHVLSSTGKQAARCRPLFAVYAAMRSLLCTQYVASMHGWWVCGLLLGMLWTTTLTPLCVHLWRTYRRKIRAQESLNLARLCTGHDGTPTTAPCDNNWNSSGQNGTPSTEQSENDWNSPGPPPPPPRNDSW